MIPTAFPVFPGDPVTVGRQVGLFCHAARTKRPVSAPPGGPTAKWPATRVADRRTHSVEDELIAIEIVGLDLDPDLLAGVHD